MDKLTREVHEILSKTTHSNCEIIDFWIEPDEMIDIVERCVEEADDDKLEEFIDLFG